MDPCCIELSKIDGVDVNSVINRLGGNEYLYTAICRKFTKDNSYQLYLESLSKNRMDTAVIQLHTLVGVAANLGFIRMEKIGKDILFSIRNQELYHINSLNIELEAEYNRIISIIKNMK